MEKKKSREKLIFISFTHYSILLCFPFFSIFLLHSYLLRFLASLSLIFPRYFGTLYIVFFPFHSLNLFFLHSESLGFLLSLSHFHYNSSERFSANPKAFLLKKRDKEISTAVPLWNYYVLSRGVIARSDLTV